MLYLVLAAYSTVFFAEMLGDKSLYTISSLTLRFRPMQVLVGITVAFAGKMLVAVLIGQTIAQLPAGVVAGASAVTFFATALVIWFRKTEGSKRERELSPEWPRATALSFIAIFFTEWADVGQIAAATLVARYHAPFLVWLGATAALITKGVLALALGAVLRKRLPQNALRYGAVAMCMVMGVLAVLRID